MEIKRIAAGILAASVAVSAVAVSAFAEDATVGNTELPADATLITLKSTGVVTFDGAYRVNICHPWAVDEQGNLLEEHNILQDKSELSGAYTLGVHFDVAEFEDYGKSFNVDINVAENGEENVQAYWGAGNSANVGVTTTPVTVDGNGDYIVWATFAQPLNADGDNFFLDITTDITKQVEAATAEAGDGIPAISIREIAVQDEPVVTPGDSAPTSEPSEPAPENPSDTPSDTPNNNNVDTGVTLAIVPAALAAAALVAAGVAAKKRK